jgi:NAD(P)-dependent dehydrogenase (short-subunit alcohol dehydrogenase family)
MNVAIVTGDSRGIGAALSESLLNRKFKVIGVGRTLNSNLKAIAERTGASYEFVQADLSDPAGLEDKVRTAFEALSRGQAARVILVHNAATAGPSGQLKNLKPSEVLEGLAVNLIAPVILSKVFLEALERFAAKKRIIHVSSGAAVRALPGSSLYCIAKAGLEMLIKTIQAESEYLASPVECVGFRPGTVDTDMQAKMRACSEDQIPIVQLFRDFHAQGKLRAPKVVADAMIRGVIEADVEPGRIYSIDEFV